MRHPVSLVLALGAVALVIADVAPAQEQGNIEGTYLQNQACRGDGRDPEFLRVKITGNEIVHSGGVCSIDNRQQDGKKISLRVTCKFKSGTVLSDTISFTLRDDKTMDMTQQHGSYTAVLNRCPG